MYTHVCIHICVKHLCGSTPMLVGSKRGARQVLPPDVLLEFTKGGSVKGGLAIYVSLSYNYCKTPFTKPPFVNSRML